MAAMALGHSKCALHNFQDKLANFYCHIRITYTQNDFSGKQNFTTETYIDKRE